MREQKNEVEKLRDQIKKLQETPESSNTSRQSTPCTPPESCSTPSMPNASLSPPNFEMCNTPSSEHQWVGGYFHEWPAAPAHENFMSGLISPTEFEGQPSYDDSPHGGYSSDGFGGNPGMMKSPPTSQQHLKSKRTGSQSKRRQTLPRSVGSPRQQAPQSPNSTWMASQGTQMDTHVPPGVGVMMMTPENQMPVYSSHFDIHGRPEEFHYPSPPHMEDSSAWQMQSDGLARSQSDTNLCANGVNGTPRTAPRSLPDSNAPILHLAVAGGHIDTLRIILKQCNVSVNIRDSAGYTPLQRAIIHGHTDIVELLLQHGAEVNMDM